jgi:hypothetical protein
MSLFIRERNQLPGTCASIAFEVLWFSQQRDRKTIAKIHKDTVPFVITCSWKLGDWEFSVVGANGTQVEAVGKLENCQGCHKSKKDSDFIFRPYLKSN